MTTVKAEYVESVMRDHGTQYWIIRDDSGKNILNRNEQDIGLESSIDKLKSSLANISGTVNVTVRNRKNTEVQSAGDKVTGVFEFKVKGSSSNGSFIGSPDLNLFGVLQENTKLQLEMQKRELESKYGTKEGSALDSALAGLLQDQTVKNLISGFAGKLMGVTPAPVQINAADPESLSTVEQAAALFSKIDPEAPEILLKLAKHIQGSPAMWFGFKDTLQSQKII
jgi:hypothetical protein